MATIGGKLSFIFAAAGLALFASNIACGQDCCSGLVVEVTPSGGTPSLDGFHISINGQWMGSTNSRGRADIPLSEDLSGNIFIEAEKDDHDVLYYGSGGAPIPCVDASARKTVKVSIRVSPQAM